LKFIINLDPYEKNIIYYNSVYDDNSGM
jgi:hypothetical protein